MSPVEQQGFEIIPTLIETDVLIALKRALGFSEQSRAGTRNALQVDPVRSLALDSRLIEIARYSLARLPFHSGQLFSKIFAIQLAGSVAPRRDVADQRTTGRAVLGTMVGQGRNHLRPRPCVGLRTNIGDSSFISTIRFRRTDR